MFRFVVIKSGHAPPDYISVVGVRFILLGGCERVAVIWLLVCVFFTVLTNVKLITS